MMNHLLHDRGVLLASGSSAAFAGGALWEFMRRVDWPSAIALVGSIASTAVAWYISRRAELTRAEIERERLLRQAQRDEQFADLLNELRIAQARREAQ